MQKKCKPHDKSLKTTMNLYHITSASKIKKKVVPKLNEGRREI